jgi:diguanylate cyclase (GGDEF)-like protein
VHDVRMFGVLSPFVGGDYYGAIIAGVNQAAAAQGDQIIAIQTLDPGSHSADHSGVPDFHRPVAWGFLNGLILLPGAVDAEYVRAAALAGKPMVLVGHDLPDQDCAAVLADNRSGVREAVTHLVQHGHSRIVFAGNLASFDQRERFQGYREALIAHGITPPEDLVFEALDSHESGGKDVAERLIRAGLPATAMVMGTDRNAIGLIQQLTAAGYELPRELAVVGFDDIADTRYIRPSLSTVRQPLDQLGAAAYHLVRDQAADLLAPPQLRQVPTLFIQRDSCGCPSDGLRMSEAQLREQFAEVAYLQMTLNIQYELGIELLGTHEREPRALAWLGRTPALGGCLGLWPDQLGSPYADSDQQITITGGFQAGGTAPVIVGSELPVSEFPPPQLFPLADGLAGDIVFVVPVRDKTHDWGLLAAVGRIQDSTPPGREMMNHSGALLAAALDHDAMLRSLHEQEEQLRNAALHDHLTGLPNRALLANRLSQAGHRALRQPDHRFAVLLLDLDGFKAVNDTLGHAAGDQLLIHVAERLTAVLRPSDTAARLGGDEFVVLLDGAVLPDGPEIVADRIRAAVNEPLLIDGQQIQVSTSIGVAFSTEGSFDPDELLREADAAMYQAKMRRKATLA